MPVEALLGFGPVRAIWPAAGPGGREAQTEARRESATPGLINLARLARLKSDHRQARSVMSKWKLEDAKDQFSRLVRRAMAGEPQRVTRRGRDAVVVVSAEEYDRLTCPAVGLVEFLERSPLIDVSLDLSRAADTSRDIDL